ncbi:aldehyde dehydrogenase iron-sulfur subunit PaoA [Duganella sp. Leaf126]|uniref:aldehyde dehydrogenase iron-sulfur subunit PaoA n=1 Tax=Duganella sp. Leaf126 TaxID=1736266 RepID=UPI0012E2C446
MNDLSDVNSGNLKLSNVNRTRRDLLIAGAITATSAAVPSVAGAQNSSGSNPTGGGNGAPAQAATPVMNKVTLVVNGQSRTLDVDTRTTLLDALRENMHLTGTKKGCDHGQCGACTVIVEGRRINSCLSLAVMHDGDKITTIEGLGTPDKLHPMQAAFVKHDGYQCGYCTPGQICSAVSALEEIKQGIPSHVTADLNTKPLLSSEELRERMSGNICRCGAYSNIIDAINDVAGSRA